MQFYGISFMHPHKQCGCWKMCTSVYGCMKEIP